KKKIDKWLKGFSEIEKVQNFILVSEEFSQENGLLTPTLKLRRKMIKGKFDL
ncbi:hypothetical protein HOC14_01480, partial [bacterium]|nr:hypothetical protein [bacterium]